MPLVPFDQLQDDARLWVFQASRALTPQERDSLLEQIDAYLGDWKAHGAPLRTGREVEYDRFLLVAADESATGASGCSIDGLTGAIREAERRLGVTFTDNASLWFRGKTGVLRRVSRDDFRTLANTGEVDPDTTVFDNTITTLDAMRGGRWELPARSSWHARVFFRDKVKA